MNRRIFSSMVLVAIFAAFSVLFVNCHPDTLPPNIFFLAKDGVSIDKKGDTVVLLYTKYVDPGCIVEDNASVTADIQVDFDGESVLPIEKKDPNHMGQLKKAGEYVVTYTATDEAGNVGTKSKKIICKNISDMYTDTYETHRDANPNGLGTEAAPMCNDTTYKSNVSSVPGVAGRLRFSKVACHVHNGQNVSFKVDADLFSPEHSPREMSAQIGYLGGKGGNKEVPIYEGLSYAAAEDSIRYDYVYLKISTQEAAVAYTENESATSYTVRILGQQETDGTPKSKIVYERNVLKRIELRLRVFVNGTPIDYVEIYKRD